MITKIIISFSNGHIKWPNISIAALKITSCIEPESGSASSQGLLLLHMVADSLTSCIKFLCNIFLSWAPSQLFNRIIIVRVRPNTSSCYQIWNFRVDILSDMKLLLSKWPRLISLILNDHPPFVSMFAEIRNSIK